ncbi:MAG: class I SAM-dependent methyltransferase [Patescibacteria group bacterium]
MDKNILVRIFGFSIMLLHGDNAVFDRWMWLRRNLKSGSLRTLDAGCGSGAFAMYAAKHGNEVVGISFDERKNKVATERAKILKIKGTHFITGDLRKLDEMKDALGLFDQIICFETIEHIVEDEKLIKDLSNILKPGGQLLLSAPYKFYLKHFLGDDKFEFSTYDTHGNLLGGEPGGHVRWGYTHEELENIFNKANLGVEKKEYISGIISQSLIVLNRFLRTRMRINDKIVWLILFPFRVLVILDTVISKLLKLPYLSVAVVGRKKT